LGGEEFRSFFNFDLSSITGTITSAELRLGYDRFGFSSPGPTETLGIFDVTTSIPALVAGSGGLSAFADLGSGTLYGSAVLPTSNPADGTASITLNTSALAGLNAEQGGQFAVGGALTALSSPLIFAGLPTLSEGEPTVLNGVVLGQWVG
jgi:hypothetical protein